LGLLIGDYSANVQARRAWFIPPGEAYPHSCE
jgi:hypothetical protein